MFDNKSELTMTADQKMLLITGLLSCWLVAGCGDPHQAKLVGNWGLETADTLLARLGDDAPSESIANEVSTPTPPKMEIQFQRNGELSTITDMGRVTPAPKRGRWELLSFDEATRILKIRCTIGLQITEHDVELIDVNTIKLTPPNIAGLRLKLTFKRMH